MSCGESLLLSSCQIRPTMKKATGSRIAGMRRQMMEKYWNFEFSEEKSRISTWIRSLQRTQISQICLVKYEERSSTTNSTILMSGQIFKALVPNCHSTAPCWWSDKHQIKSSCRKSVSGRNSLKELLLGSQLGTIHAPNWNSVQPWVDLSWQSVSCLVRYGSSRGFRNNPKKKASWLWQKDLAGSMLVSRAKNSHRSKSRRRA